MGKRLRMGASHYQILQIYSRNLPERVFLLRAFQTSGIRNGYAGFRQPIDSIWILAGKRQQEPKSSLGAERKEHKYVLPQPVKPESPVPANSTAVSLADYSAIGFFVLSSATITAAAARAWLA